MARKRPAAQNTHFEGFRARPAGLGILPPAVLANLLAEFIGELPGRAQQIEAAWQQKAPKELAHWAHQLKGAAAIYGFDEIADCAKVIHDQAATGDGWPKIESAVAELGRLCRQAVELSRTIPSP